MKSDKVVKSPVGIRDRLWVFSGAFQAMNLGGVLGGELGIKHSSSRNLESSRRALLPSPPHGLFPHLVLTSLPHLLHVSCSRTSHVAIPRFPSPFLAWFSLKAFTSDLLSDIFLFLSPPTPPQSGDKAAMKTIFCALLRLQCPEQSLSHSRCPMSVHDGKRSVLGSVLLSAPCRSYPQLSLYSASSNARHMSSAHWKPRLVSVRGLCPINDSISDCQ